MICACVMFVFFFFLLERTTVVCCCFVFQAEDGIRDRNVTGVQTCALPIFTHDQIEAMTMADTIVVMHDGIVEQIGTPLELYDRPDNQFVAGFIGSPAMNFLKGQVKSNGSAGFEGPNGVKLPLALAPANSEGRPAVYGIRPEHFTIADDGAEAEIVVVEPTGSETQVFAKLGGEEVVAVFRERHKFEPGDKVRLRPDPMLVHLFDEATGKRLNA